MTRTDSLDQTALAYIGERYPEWIARYRTNEDHSGPFHNDAINMLCLLEDAAKEIADLKDDLNAAGKQLQEIKDAVGWFNPATEERAIQLRDEIWELVTNR